MQNAVIYSSGFICYTSGESDELTQLYQGKGVRDMKLMIKQRVFSWGDKYDIYDEMGIAKYFVKGDVFSLGHQLHVFDSSGNEIGQIHQKLFRFMPTFEIVINGNVCGRIHKKFTFFSEDYDVDYNGWYVEGDFLGWEYSVYECGRPIVRISKELFTWGDTYVIDIDNTDDEIMGLMLVIAIDAANCSHSN